MCDGVVGNAADYQLVVSDSSCPEFRMAFHISCTAASASHRGEKNPTARGTQQYMVYIQQASVFACNDLVGMQHFS